MARFTRIVRAIAALAAGFVLLGGAYDVPAAEAKQTAKRHAHKAKEGERGANDRRTRGRRAGRRGRRARPQRSRPQRTRPGRVPERVPPKPSPAPAPPASPPAAEPPIADPPAPPAPVAEPPAAGPAAELPGAIGALDIRVPFPAGLRAFGDASVWNQPLTDGAPLDPASNRLSSALADQVQREIETRKGPWINTTRWSVPVYVVGADVPRVYVHLDNNKPALQRDFASVPVPANAIPSNDADATLAIYQPATDTYWDFWRMRRADDGWHAVWGGKMTDASSNPGYFLDKRGASASGVPLLAGLITIAELRAGRIDHALALAVPTTAAGTFVWPAQRSDGKTTGPTAIPEGTRFRIDRSVDLDKLGLTPAGLAIARAVQRYGMIVRDGAGNVTFFAEDPAPTGGNPYGALFRGRYANEVLRGFPWDRLQVVAPPSG
jgi:hypothetical protein